MEGSQGSNSAQHHRSMSALTASLIQESLHACLRLKWSLPQCAWEAIMPHLHMKVADARLIDSQESVLESACKCFDLPKAGMFFMMTLTCT